jgi:hypothetical protein
MRPACASAGISHEEESESAVAMVNRKLVVMSATRRPQSEQFTFRGVDLTLSYEGSSRKWSIAQQSHPDTRCSAKNKLLDFFQGLPESNVSNNSKASLKVGDTVLVRPPPKKGGASYLNRIMNSWREFNMGGGKDVVFDVVSKSLRLVYEKAKDEHKDAFSMEQYSSDGAVKELGTVLWEDDTTTTDVQSMVAKALQMCADFVEDTVADIDHGYFTVQEHGQYNLEDDVLWKLTVEEGSEEGAMAKATAVAMGVATAVAMAQGASELHYRDMRASVVSVPLAEQAGVVVSSPATAEEAQTVEQTAEAAAAAAAGEAEAEVEAEAEAEAEEGDIIDELSHTIAKLGNPDDAREDYFNANINKRIATDPSKSQYIHFQELDHEAHKVRAKVTQAIDELEGIKKTILLQHAEARDKMKGIITTFESDEPPTKRMRA